LDAASLLAIIEKKVGFYNDAVVAEPGNGSTVEVEQLGG
jgi:hypothetical protein